MTEELFPPETMQMDSPRLAWIKKHGIATCHSCPSDPECARWFATLWDFAEDYEGMDEAGRSKDEAEMLIIFELGRNGEQRCGSGKTEDEAITDLALNMEIPLWNEEATS